MPSRQDQLHSYQYSQQRVVAALVGHDPDPQRSPLRRAGTTALVSVVVAAVVLCAVAIYGLLTGTSDVDLRDDSAVFVDEDSGARYVWSKQDEQLHPVLNFTSGLLIANGSGRKVVTTTGKRLATVPLGDRLGIPDAPDSLPGPKNLVADPWSVCTVRPPGAPAAEVRSTVLVGAPPRDGTAVERPTGTRAGLALLVRDRTDRTFLVYGNRRFAVPPDRVEATISAFGWSDRQPFPVSTAWIDAVPAGVELRAPTIDGAGSPGWGGAEVGRLLTDGRQYAVVVRDGTAAITEVQAKLFLAAPGAEKEVLLDSVGFINRPGSRSRLSTADTSTGLPSTVPQLAAPARSLCLSLPVTDDRPAIRIDATVPAGTDTGTTAREPRAACPGTGADSVVVTPRQADLVYVQRGRGALVAAVAAPGAGPESGTVSVVTDRGVQYPLASRELLPRLGFAPQHVRAVPSELVALLPQGPSLDPAKARQVCP